MKTERTTIYDIAREAGVSPATVSRIINGTAKVSKAKQDQVKDAMEKYLFVPNSLAKGSTGRASKIIGLLLSDVRNPFYASFYVGFETAAVRSGYTVILLNALNDEEIERQQMELLLGKSVDIIIICGGRTDTVTPDEEQVSLMNRVSRKLPVIVVGTADYFPCSRIKTDNRPAMEALMGYLIGLGHRKFAMLGGCAEKTPTRDKQELFRDILKRNGLPCREDWIVETPKYSIADGYEVGKKFLHQKELPTAILGMNEFIALGIMRAAAEQGLHVPEDLSVAGFDNTYLSEICTPPLTSAGCMYDEYGEALMEIVVKMIENPQHYMEVTVPAGLMVRRSCAKPITLKTY